MRAGLHQLGHTSADKPGLGDIDQGVRRFSLRRIQAVFVCDLIQVA